MAFGGAGIGRIDGKVVFIPYTAPGDEVLVEITSEKKSFSEGTLIEVITPSDDRVIPRCPVFGVCGGCSYQHLDYRVEARWKEELFLDALKRIGRVSPVEVEPAILSPEPYGYRSRARFHVKGGRIGFFAPGTNEVVDIDDCPILAPQVNAAFGRIKEVFKGGGAGALKTITSFEVGLSQKDDKTAAAFYLDGRTGFPWADLLVEVPGLKGVEVLRSVKEHSGRENSKGRLIAAEGDIRLSYCVAGLDFLVPLRVFSQVNRFQNTPLVERVLRYAAPEDTEKRLGTVVDLYAGAGNITLPLAVLAERAIGVESDGEAVKSAEANSKSNALRNVAFLRKKASGWIDAESRGLEKEGVDVVVLDPPRGGDRKVARGLAGLKPDMVIYVSCSPPTLARDLNVLAAGGLKPTKACHIDMFPRTSHIEGIVVLE